MAARIGTDYDNILVLQDTIYCCFACHAQKRVSWENIESSRMRCELPVEIWFVIYPLPVVWSRPSPRHAEDFLGILARHAPASYASLLSSAVPPEIHTASKISMESNTVTKYSYNAPMSEHFLSGQMWLILFIKQLKVAPKKQNWNVHHSFRTMPCILC